MTDTARLVARSRNFFGIVRVLDVTDPAELSITYRRFVHGNTLHGMQRLDAEHRRTPLTYYFHNGPIGQFFAVFAGTEAKQHVAVLGLGAGTLASYAERGQQWAFFEIDPAVIREADEHFTYLLDARERGAEILTVLGDGRLALQAVPNAHCDLIFADAFSSDAVPVHLLTREALELYLGKLADKGILVFNVTNRYLDLEPVLAGLAEEKSLVARIREDTGADIAEEDRKHGKTPSRWIVLARHDGDLHTLARDERWRPLRLDPRVGIWTDEFSNLLSVFRWLPPEFAGSSPKR